MRSYACTSVSTYFFVIFSRLPSAIPGSDKPVPPSFQKIKALFGDGPEGVGEPHEQLELRNENVEDGEGSDQPATVPDEIKEGWLNVKVAAIDGKVGIEKIAQIGNVWSSLTHFRESMQGLHSFCSLPLPASQRSFVEDPLRHPEAKYDVHVPG